MTLDIDSAIQIAGIVAAASSLITAIATCLLAVFAFTTFRAALRQVQLMSEDSDRQTRPYVTLELAAGLHGSGHWDLTIENTGHSPARQVTVDAGAIQQRDDSDHLSEPLQTYFQEPFTLHPGAHRRVMWRKEATEHRGEMGADTHVNVSVLYSDDRDVDYAEAFTISTDLYGSISPAPTTGPKLEGASMSKSEASLANIERALRTVNHHVGMLRR